MESPLRNRNGVLWIGGCGVIELADKYGTPLYVTDENRIRDNCRRFRGAFLKHLDSFKLSYALKANSNIALLNVIRQEGCGADCSCVPELQLASMARFSSDAILYTGSYNSDEELKYAINMGATINLDDISILGRLAKIGLPDILSFRINPGFGRGGHEKVMTAGPGAKFGMSERVALKAYEDAKRMGVERFGIHMMAGSSVLDPAYFAAVNDKLFEIASAISRKVGIEFEFVDIGGGFGVPYRSDERVLDVERLAREICSRFKRRFESQSCLPVLIAEPGRYIVCDSTVLLGRVHSVKRADKTFIGTDIGMNILLRPALYDAYHEILVANRLDARRREKVDVVGQICESSDFLARDRLLPVVREGDVLAVLNAGAYGASMSSNYNSRPRAAEVLVKGGEDFLVREREDISDILDRQRVPARLLR